MAPILSKLDVESIAERFTDNLVNKAIEDPLETITTADSVLSIASKVLPTLPWETPIPIPRALYEQLKTAEVK